MWIMLIAKLPVAKEVSPPKMSIHWSTLWPYDPYQNLTKRQQKKHNSHMAKMLEEDRDLLFGNEPDYENARRILYNGENIRVWPHEFSRMTPEKMKMYIMEECSHELVTCEYLDHVEYEGEKTKALILDKVTTPIFEAALLDGCTESQAKLITVGMDITVEDPEFPPIGWYRIKEEFGLIFCDKEELVIYSRYLKS